ncbi:YciI family protein [Kordiimonas gwangyangensis]|uniref:YciI family protein n=1 Tax=Kordiimonas gwangyangensis TaxID=288022 RepID=UPI0003739E02|nr:YciI family protein [Kordiimonas gwangyangensis]
MFIVTLRMSGDRAKAPALKDGHNAWIKQGFADGAFLAVGNLEPGPGGVLLVQESDLKALEKRVNADPFVAEGVVTPEVIQFTPKKTDDQLSFLLEG